MNVVLWILQVVLTIKLVQAAYTHGLGTGREKMQRGIQRIGPLARPLLVLGAAGMLLAAVGLIVPAATGVLTGLTPATAAALAAMMLAGAGLHAVCREGPGWVVGLVLAALAAFLAYGRWVLAPL